MCLPQQVFILISVISVVKYVAKSLYHNNMIDKSIQWTVVQHNI